MPFAPVVVVELEDAMGEVDGAGDGAGAGSGGLESSGVATVFLLLSFLDLWIEIVAVGAAGEVVGATDDETPVLALPLAGSWTRPDGAGGGAGAMGCGAGAGLPRSGLAPGNEAAKEMQRMEAMRARLLAARKGIEDADAGTLAGKPLAGGEAFDKSSTREIEREIAKEKLQQLQGGVEKELKELDLEQAERVAKAKEVGADLTKIEELFQEKRRTVIQKYADERSKIADEEAKKRMEDGARWEEEMNRQAQSVQEAQSGAIFDLKKLYIEATKEGKDKELALLEVERDEALKKAFEEGVPQEYVDAAFEIKKAMVEAADAGERQKSAAVGMFSPARLEALGILDEPIRQTAKAAEKISETTRKMLDELILQRQWNCFE